MVVASCAPPVTQARLPLQNVSALSHSRAAIKPFRQASVCRSRVIVGASPAGASLAARTHASRTPSVSGGCFGLRPVGPGLGNRFQVVCNAHAAIPAASGLFDPANDKDACGVGFVGELNKQPSRKCITDALEMLARMTHRGACGCETNTGTTHVAAASSSAPRSVAPVAAAFRPSLPADALLLRIR
jgi:hypothetical protein